MINRGRAPVAGPTCRGLKDDRTDSAVMFFESFEQGAPWFRTMEKNKFRLYIFNKKPNLPAYVIFAGIISICQK